MLEKPQTRARDRGKDGRFITIKNGLEDTYDIFCLVMKLIPFFIFIIFTLNYFGLWKHLKAAYNLIVNLGDPNCRFKCEYAGPVDDVE